MCYKAEVQNRNEEKLNKMLDEYNVPEFIRDYFVQISSRAARINYWVTIKDMLLWLLNNKYINKDNIEDVTPEDIANIRKPKMISYLNYLKSDKEIKLTTLQTKKNQLGSFWEYLKEEECVKSNIIHAIKSEEFKPAKTNRLKAAKYPLHEDIEKMIDKINWKKDEFVRERNMTVFRVLRGTGLRESELAGLDFGDVYLNEQHPYILVISKGTYDYTDDGKDIVYLTKDATEALRSWFEYRKKCGVKPVDQDAVFINKNGKRFSEDNIKSMFKNYSDGKLTPHMMRHEYITVITRESGDITFAQEQARHKSSAVTMNSYDSGASRSLSVLENL